MDCGSHLPGWKIARLDEVCELRKASVHPADYPDMPYVGLEHIDSGNPRLKRNGIATEVNSTKSRFFAGDILYGKLRPYLDKAVLAEFDGLCSTDILVLRPKELALSEYLINVIHKDEFLSYAINSSKGVNHPRTSWSSLSAFQFMLPPLPEQRAMSDVLGAVQQAREARLRELELERERKAALMEHLFTHGTRGEPTKQTEIGEMPESWEIKNLGDIARIERGKFTHRPRNDPAFYGGSTPFIQTGDVATCDGHIKTYSQTLNERGLSVSKVFPSGTIVITIAANIGFTGILEFDSAFPDSLIGITPSILILNEYLNYYLSTQQKEMDEIAPRGTQKNINIEFLMPWPAILPSIAEQKEIALSLRAC